MATVQNSGCGNSKSNSDPPASAHIKRRSCKVAVLRPPIPLYYLSTHVNLKWRHVAPLDVLWPPGPPRAPGRELLKLEAKPPQPPMRLGAAGCLLLVATSIRLGPARGRDSRLGLGRTSDPHAEGQDPPPWAQRHGRASSRGLSDRAAQRLGLPSARSRSWPGSSRWHCQCPGQSRW